MSSGKYQHTIPGNYVFDGMVLGYNITVENILRVQAMELEPSDVVVASYPKTGTTLLQEIVWLIRNNGDTDAANETMIVARVPWMEAHAKSFDTLPHPRHMKTHMPYRYLPKSAHEGKTKVVYVVRNPKDALVSFYHFYRSNKALGSFAGTWDDFFHYFLDGGLVYGNLLDHMRGYWEHRNDNNICIVTYEEMIRERHRVIKTIAEFLKWNLNEEIVDKIAEATQFEVMKANPMTNFTKTFLPDGVLDQSISPFMRSGKVGDWKNYFTDDQNRIMDEMVREKLSGTDLKFVYE